tara:strand:- start:2925 stop:6599 length:3675 start_codon:yes stop_codon:yes gene_type:complete
MKKALSLSLFFLALIINSCATFKAQYTDNYKPIEVPDKKVEHTFYLMGDAGNSSEGEMTQALKDFKKELDKATKNSTAIFLGDNIYPKGLPKKSESGRAFAEHQLNVQTDVAKDFKGRTIFIPGNHDWYSNGLKGLKRQEKYIEDRLGKNTFLPENGCPIRRVKVSDDVVLIIIDSEWYLTNWDTHPTINDECDIKTRTQFFVELEGEIKKARDKTTIIALHHPMFSNGSHGGQYSFGSHMTPLPVLGTLKNVLRHSAGLSTVDIQNPIYNEFKKRLVTLSQENDKVIFVSGHEHNLQYLVQDNIPQIISGSGSKLTATRNVGGGKFSYASPGYAKLSVYKDGSSFVQFYSSDDKKEVFSTEVLPQDEKEEIVNYPSNFEKTKTASVYTEEETTKGNLYKFFWGERYRDVYSTKVTVPTVNLDTLLGGLKPVRKGGGHQSKSLRLKDNQGREYVMRALKKQALQYLQTTLFLDQYIEGQFDNTYTEDLVMDVFTGAHPYAPFVIGKLSDAVDVYHTNPTLYYVPKQNALQQFNSEFGDELYMIEERTSDGHGDKASFGFSDEMISTDEMLSKINKDEDIIVDQAFYIRARLFDMLIGDWDRHTDQWRWAKFKENGQTVYRPVPRDRDQAFSIMGDGFLLGIGTSIISTARLLKSYEEELNHLVGFNLEPYPLDMALINQSDRGVWNQQVKLIVDGLTDDVIDDAFKLFPKEVQGADIEDIKRKLKGRRANLQLISDGYYDIMVNYSVIRGTNKDDYFEIKRDGNVTRIKGYRIKDGEKADVFYDHYFNHDETKEIWIYGLDDEDVFKVFGTGENLTKVFLIGGQNNDIYDIQNGNRIKIFDYKSKKNTFLTNKGGKKLNDNYTNNVYDYKKLKSKTFSIIPTIGANPDDGIKFGTSATYLSHGLVRNPFTSKHKLAASYYLATNGFDFGYDVEFVGALRNLNIGLQTKFTSPNYAVNFFGYGNETSNPESEEDDGLDVGLDYNRVKLREFSFKPSIVWRGRLGASFRFGFSYESYEINKTEGRFINTLIGNNIEESNDFIGTEANYTYDNKDNPAFPTLGMETGITLGYKSNTGSNKGFGYLIPHLAFDHKIDASGQLVFATKVKAHLIFGDDFEFYQAANIGANNGLRGFRNERFTGKNAFVQTTDLRLNLRKVKTGLLPLNIGIYGGVDYGRVWLDAEDSDKWNTSIGGGVFANLAQMATFNLSAFNSDDGLRLAFKVGFGF